MSTKNSNHESRQIAAPAGEIRFFVPPALKLFANRAERFRHLANDHALKDYLGFLATLSGAQQEALNQFPTLPHSDLMEVRLCRKHGMPFLAALSWRRDPAWQEALNIILHRMKDASLPPEAHTTISGLLCVGAARLEQLADSILSGEFEAVSPGELPFVAAALQVYWVQMALEMEEQSIVKLEKGGICPLCGSLPTAGLVYSVGNNHGLRYLCCSLCASQWHMVRLKCSSCESTHGINHHILEGTNGAVKAESCDDCDSYLKMMYLEKDHRMESTADDLATLALDMLMDNECKARRGPNLFLHPGSGE